MDDIKRGERRFVGILEDALTDQGSKDGTFEVINVKEVVDEEIKDPEFAKAYKKLEIEELKFEIKSLGQKVEAMFESYLGERSKLMFKIDKLEKLEDEVEEKI